MPPTVCIYRQLPATWCWQQGTNCKGCGGDAEVLLQTQLNMFNVSINVYIHNKKGNRNICNKQREANVFSEILQENASEIDLA